MASSKLQLTQGIFTMGFLVFFLLLGGVYLLMHKEKPGQVIAFYTNIPSSIPAVQTVTDTLTTPTPTSSADQTQIPSLNPVSDTSSGQVLAPAVPVVISTPTEVQPVFLGEPIDTFQGMLGADYSFVSVVGADPLIFETLTPYSTLVKIDKFSILKSGGIVGTVYVVRKKDPNVRSILDLLKQLATTVKKDDKVSIQETNEFGKGGFYYNHLDKKDYIRIVVSSKDGVVIAFDYQRQLHSEFEKILRIL